MHARAQTPIKKVRVIVALADNTYQGIVPVSASLGNGQNPKSNLYWGAMYGVKSYFRRHKNWEQKLDVPVFEGPILEIVRFESVDDPKTLIHAEAWDGRNIKDALNAFYATLDDSADPNTLVVFVGHNGHMDEYIYPPVSTPDTSAANLTRNRQAIVLACQSKSYMESSISNAGVNPLLMTRGNMAPEAYSLEAAIDTWRTGAGSNKVRMAAAKAYSKYQKIPIKNSNWLFGVHKN